MNSTFKIYNKEGEDLLILLYHGVTNIKNRGIENYNGKHIYENIFYKHLRLLKKLNFNFLSLDEIVDIHINKKKFPKKSVSITFDDGFLNNFLVACPILESFQIPCVFYVSPGMIGTKDMFWVDKVQACIDKSKVDIINIKLDKYYKFTLKNKKDKINATEVIKKFCKQIHYDKKDLILNELSSITKVNPSSDISDNYKLMKWNHLQKINQNKLFTIGGHNYFHNSFKNLKKSSYDREIKSTISLLQKKIKSNIFHYSYPEGQKQDYNDYVIKILKKNKIKCCPSALYGFNNHKTNLFNLKRIMPGFMNIPFPVK